MKKKILLVLLTIITFMITTKVSALDKINITKEENKNEITLTLNFDSLDEKINVIKGKITYNKDDFELKENDLTAQNNWTNLKYNEATGEFIIINNEKTNDLNKFLKITLTSKKNIFNSEVKIENLLASDGNKDIEINGNNIILEKEEIKVPDTLARNGLREALPYIIIEILLALTIIIAVKKKKSSILILLITLALVNNNVYAEELKGDINKDGKIDINDIDILEEYLINLNDIENKTLADLNSDNNITVTDLSLLIENTKTQTETKENKDNNEKKDDNKKEEISYRDTTSMYAWESGSPLNYSDSEYNILKTLKTSTLYQSVPGSKLTKQNIGDAVKKYNEKGIKIYRLIGDSSWAFDNTDAKREIDEIQNYNNSVEELSKINGVVLDIEPHANSLWKQNKDKQDEYFTQYTNNMIDLYNYAKKYNLEVVICIPRWYERYTYFEKLFESAADVYSVMNYGKNGYISNMKEEVNLAEKYNKKVESVLNADPNDEENISYYNDGITKMLEVNKDVLNTYNYKYLRTSFHHMEYITKMMNR